MSKNFLITSVFLSFFISLFLINVPQAKALTAEEISSQISQLQVQIAEIQKQIAQIQSLQMAGKETALVITSPNGGEKWEMGSIHEITWLSSTSSSPITKIKLELYQASRLVVAQLIVFPTENDGIYSWKIPTTLLAGTDYKIKITAISGPAVTDVSDRTFEIYFNPASLAITSPNGGEKWEMGSTYDINWYSFGSIPATNVKLELYRGDNLIHLITQSTENNGTSSWKIPFTLSPAVDYKIKITDISRPAITDVSNNNFEISYQSISEKLKIVESQLSAVVEEISSLLEEIKKLSE